MVEFEQYKYEWNQYKDKVKELAASFDIETKENRIREIEEAMEQQEFWDDVEKSQKLMKELKNLKSQIDTISKIQSVMKILDFDRYGQKRKMRLSLKM